MSSDPADIARLREIEAALRENRAPGDRDEFNALIARIAESGDRAEAVPLLQSTAEAADKFLAIYKAAELGKQPGMWILEANCQELARGAREAIEKINARTEAEGGGVASDTAGSEARAADWYDDPSGKHQLRYWDGSAWTGHVADDGQQSTDPFEQPASGGTKTIPTIVREFMADHEDEIQNLPGTQSLEFIDVVRSLVNSGFSAAEVQRVQQMPGKMGDLGREFLATVQREAG